MTIIVIIKKCKKRKNKIYKKMKINMEMDQNIIQYNNYNNNCNISSNNNNKKQNMNHHNQEY